MLTRLMPIPWFESSHVFPSRLQSLAVEYKKLEDEFRDALKIEERRYHEV